MYVHMFSVVDTAVSYGRTSIICWFLLESSKVKESSLHEIWNADTAFLLGGAEMEIMASLGVLGCQIEFPYFVCQ